MARELDISDTSIHQWRKELTEHDPRASKYPSGDTAVSIKRRRREEVRRLKRELELVKQERDILKKAISIFSHEKP